MSSLHWVRLLVAQVQAFWADDDAAAKIKTSTTPNLDSMFKGEREEEACGKKRQRAL